MLETQLRRIHAQLLGDLVDVDFEREAAAAASRGPVSVHTEACS